MTFWLITKRQAQISIWNTSNISSIEVKIVTGDKTQQYGSIEIWLHHILGGNLLTNIDNNRHQNPFPRLMKIETRDKGPFFVEEQPSQQLDARWQKKPCLGCYAWLSQAGVVF